MHKAIKECRQKNHDFYVGNLNHVKQTRRITVIKETCTMYAVANVQSDQRRKSLVYTDSVSSVSAEDLNCNEHIKISHRRGDQLTVILVCV